MKTHLFPALKLTLVCLLIFSGLYTVVIWGIGQLISPNCGKGEISIYYNADENSEYGFTNIGQSFTADSYFWSRPSAVGCNAAGSGASNKGASNEEYLALVSARMDTFLVHNPSVKKSDIPVELVTASGSGLDPHLSQKAALVQIPRIAKARNVSEMAIVKLVNDHMELPLLGCFGPSQVNVLKLNIALNHISASN